MEHQKYIMRSNHAAAGPQNFLPGTSLIYNKHSQALCASTYTCDSSCSRHVCLGPVNIFSCLDVFQGARSLSPGGWSGLGWLDCQPLLLIALSASTQCSIIQRFHMVQQRPGSHPQLPAARHVELGWVMELMVAAITQGAIK